jgi:hypothetical protein
MSMSSSKKKSSAAPVDKASATIKSSTNTDSLKVSVTATLAQTMAKSPDWAAATGVQTAVQAWTGSATAIGANTQTVQGLKAQLAAAEVKQRGLRRDWVAARKQVISSVTVYCGGSADKVTGFGLDVIAHGRIGLLAAPIDLTVNPGTLPGEVVCEWTKGVAGHGFVVQHATDPNNAATVSGSIPSTKPKWVLDGLASGAAVSVRVAAIDPASPTGQSPWTSWILGNAK